MSPPRKKRPAGPVPVESIDHRDGRANIPTGELRDFVAADEAVPPEGRFGRTIVDPELAWRGKDALDAAELIVPSVPVYIQETVHPRAIIESLRDTADGVADEPELSLFDDLYEPEFDRRVEFYEHEERWKNRLILGDSLLVMTSLAERERLRGRVQMIYMDPPYGIRFQSNWQVSTRKRDVKDGKVADATRQPEQIRAFRDTWADGVHTYLTYLRDRLTVARELLTESGSIFVQIGDENVHLVRSLLDEVFGAENFVSAIVLRTTSGAGSPTGGTTSLASVHDYALWFARARESLKYRQLFVQRSDLGGVDLYRRVRLPDDTVRTLRGDEDPATLPDGSRLFVPDNLTSQSSPEGAQFAVEFDGKMIRPTKGGWKTNKTGMGRLGLARRLFLTSKGSLRYVRFADDFPMAPLNNVWTDVSTGSFTDDKIYVVQTNVKIVQRCMLMTTDPGDLVLDPTCGSGTTAVVAEQWGRRWITTDTSRVAVALTRTRLMAARHPAYRLNDEENRDIRRGFQCRMVPHVTLKSIVQNPDIREGMSHAEIEAVIARDAPQEVLVDQPLVDTKAVRVSGPFTVESISPHRVMVDPIDVVDDAPPVPGSGERFAETILDNLRAAGVQNTVRDERIEFELLEFFAGEWINAAGDFVDAQGERRSVAVSLGPEYGTVDGHHVKEAAKEAVKGTGFDLVLVCGFAFDADAGERAAEFRPTGDDGWAVAAEERRMGRLPVLLVRMNPDLSMGDELLKKTGAGNLFMVFGEPDVSIEREDDGKVVVEVRGVDVYDPTTGTHRAGEVDDIACWMIDTDYDGECFLVRHAYFLGGDKHPYQKLRTALKADIDAEAWESLRQSRSRPFPVPDSRRIAVKVINHYGDEVLKVYRVDI